MFKLNDKKHRKRALMKLQCAPNKCSSTDDKDDDFYEVQQQQHQQVSNKTMEYAVQYNLEDAPSHLVRKTMKYEEIKGGDEVDNAGTSRVSKTITMEFPSVRRGSKVTRERARAQCLLNEIKMDQGQKR
jgi:hypothetical protein